MAPSVVKGEGIFTVVFDFIRASSRRRVPKRRLPGGAYPSSPNPSTGAEIRDIDDNADEGIGQQKAERDANGPGVRRGMWFLHVRLPLLSRGRVKDMLSFGRSCSSGRPQ